MAYIATTYTFSNSTTADATQVNQNFTDIINGLSDSTKDLAINALALAGNLTVNGNSTLGNASSDTLTVTASLASTILVGTTNSYDIGSTTSGLRVLYFGANSKIVGVKASASMSADWTLTLPVTAGTSGYFLKTDGAGVSSWSDWTRPTVQTFTSGSGTYTTPAGVKYIRVRIVGGGGGGAGSSTAAANDGGDGGAGGNTTFGSSMLSANGGAGGLHGADAGGAGGSASLGTGPIGIALTGGMGSGGGIAATGFYATGMPGSSGHFGGSGGGGKPNGAGTAAKSNTGSGGGAAGSPITGYSGGSGGSGGFVDSIITSPAASYAYAVGAAGSAGSAGTSGSAGGAGGSGVIHVEEYYQ